jgi:hypothetical protein
MRYVALWMALAVGSLACGSSPPSEATQNPVFYEYRLGGRGLAGRLEWPYSPLDQAKTPSLPEFKGVAVLGRKVRLSRPAGWVIRSGSAQPGRRYIEYVSPKQYIFSLYERSDPPGATWPSVLQRYEAELRRSRARVIARSIPMATFNAQGRQYVVERTVAAPGAPFVNLSREFLVRNRRRVVLVQVVHQGATVQAISDELGRALGTLSVL